MQETQVPSLGGEDPQEKGMVTHSSVLAWKIPWKEERGGLQTMGHKEWDTTERPTLSLVLSQFTCDSGPLNKVLGACRGAFGGTRPRSRLLSQAVSLHVLQITAQET